MKLRHQNLDGDEYKGLSVDPFTWKKLNRNHVNTLSENFISFNRLRVIVSQLKLIRYDHSRVGIPVQ